MTRQEVLDKYNAKPDVKARKHAWYMAHREETIKRAEQWAKAHPEKRKETAAKWARKDYFGGNRPEKLTACEKCGSDYRLHVHHRDGNNGKNGNPANHDPSNLVVLCNRCHTSVHNHGRIREFV